MTSLPSSHTRTAPVPLMARLWLLVSSALRMLVHRAEKSPVPTASGTRLDPNIPLPGAAPSWASTRVATGVPEKFLLAK
jgi:hypothetical protein